MSPSVDVLTRVVQACGLDLLVRLVPRDAGEWSAVQDSQEASLDARLEKLIGFVDVIEDGAEVKQTTREKKTLKHS